jgi:phosphoserine phosphatase RsbU/P
VFCVADVSGKGMSAAFLMSNIQATFHSLISYTHNLKDIILELNKRVWTNTSGERFVSLFLGKVNTKSKQLTYINAGHNPPVLLTDSSTMRLTKGCTLLGISEYVPSVEVEILDLQNNFMLFAYTDGLTDTMNEEGEYLGEQTIIDIIAKNYNAEPSFINDAILHYAEEFKMENQFSDDIALLTIKCL